MRLIRLAFGIFLVFMGPALADETGCPAYHGRNLRAGVSVFDGPPEGKADLVPDRSKGAKEIESAEWDVGYLYDQGRTVFLVCRYAGTSDSVTIKIDRKVQRCLYKKYGKTLAEMTCQ